MNVQPISQNKSAPSFKQVYPVMHCVQVEDTLYRVASDMKLIKTLQRKLVTMLNKPEKYYFDFQGKSTLGNAANNYFAKIEANNIEEAVREFFEGKDIDYRMARESLKKKIRQLMAKIINLKEQGLSANKEEKELDALKESATLIRSFYNEANGDLKNGNWPSFLISGIDFIKDFTNRCVVKNKGGFGYITKHSSPIDYSGQTLYQQLGYEFVNRPSNRMIDVNGISYYLRTIFVPVKDKNGNIKNYNLLKLEFLPTGKKAPS